MGTVAQNSIQWTTRCIVLVRHLQIVWILQRYQAMGAVVDIDGLVIVISGLGADVVTRVIGPDQRFGGRSTDVCLRNQTVLGVEAEGVGDIGIGELSAIAIDVVAVGVTAAVGI